MAIPDKQSGLCLGDLYIGDGHAALTMTLLLLTEMTHPCMHHTRGLPTFVSMLHPKHEVIYCDRCSATFECKANSFTKCQCSTVQLTLNEVQYVSELYEGCLCAKCLVELQQEYREENSVAQ